MMLITIPIVKHMVWHQSCAMQNMINILDCITLFITFAIKEAKYVIFCYSQIEIGACFPFYT